MRVMSDHRVPLAVPKPGSHPSARPAPGPGTAPCTEPTELDTAVEAALRRLGTRNAVAMLSDGRASFALRATTARAAGRSLDLQYYIWRGDLTGQLLAWEVLRAADRGVQVRLLLDDVYALGRERVLAALDAHPNIQVRLFNGTRWRAFGRLGFALEFLFGGWHLNRRMHNKAWIADGCLAIGGGRNVGDEYFGGAEALNFRDLDLVLAGHAVESTQAVFERYWHSPLARPAGNLSAARDAKGGLPALRQDLARAAGSIEARSYLERVAEQGALERTARSLLAVAEGGIRVVSDPPEKAARGLGARRRARAAGGLSPDIAEALRGAQREALLISPYFVPGRLGLALLADLARRGVRVSVVTNSLAATDVVAAHGGYARYRRGLLQAGVELFELKSGGEDGATILGSRGATLHTKAIVVDQRLAFVGSFNLDPRSASLNTEMGVFVSHIVLARELREEHARLTDPARSWRVTLLDGRLAWTEGVGGPVTFRREPRASLGRRVLAKVIRWLPIESQL